MKAIVFVVASYGIYAQTEDGLKVCIDAVNMPSKDYDYTQLKVGDEVEIKILLEVGLGYASGELLKGQANETTN